MQQWLRARRAPSAPGPHLRRHQRQVLRGDDLVSIDVLQENAVQWQVELSCRGRAAGGRSWLASPCPSAGASRASQRAQSLTSLVTKQVPRTTRGEPSGRTTLASHRTADRRERPAARPALLERASCMVLSGVSGERAGAIGGVPKEAAVRSARRPLPGACPGAAARLGAPYVARGGG
jgi:hypothetical protein